MLRFMGSQRVGHDLSDLIVFPVIRYECESWTVKKAEELMLLNCGVGEDS